MSFKHASHMETPYNDRCTDDMRLVKQKYKVLPFLFRPQMGFCPLQKLCSVWSIASYCAFCLPIYIIPKAQTQTHTYSHPQRMVKYECRAHHHTMQTTIYSAHISSSEKVIQTNHPQTNHPQTAHSGPCRAVYMFNARVAAGRGSTLKNILKYYNYLFIKSVNLFILTLKIHLRILITNYNMKANNELYTVVQNDSTIA